MKIIQATTMFKEVSPLVYKSSSSLKTEQVVTLWWDYHLGAVIQSH